jgi:hypothetical protein
MPSKVIVTNRSAMSAKYGRKLARIDRALARLVAADKKRGLQTTIVDVSNKAQMAAVGGARVKSARNGRQNKSAIDAIFHHHEPDYLMILGAPDVIPHQRLINTLKDDDRGDVMSDLPYASDAPYSRRIRDFKAPTRVVGRLPDLAGGSDPAYLLTLLGVAAKWKGRPRRTFAKFFAISAAVWKRSTRLSLKRLFGGDPQLRLSPLEGPKWPGPFVGRRIHFINCHGDTNDFQFYGDPEIAGAADLPIAHAATNLARAINEGTVVAAECCYGTELWNIANAPSPGVFGICSTYLAQKAYGFFGSTNIAYGEEVSNDDADLICRFFLASVLDGASLGRAVLEARQRYIENAQRLDQSDLKTLGQFLLLGDPSIHPVKARPAARPKGGGSKRRSTRAKRPGFAGATARREALAVKGVRAAARTPATARPVAAPRISALAAGIAREAGLTKLKTTTNAVEVSPAVPMARTAGRRAKAAKAVAALAGVNSAPSEVCVVVGKPKQSRQRGSAGGNVSARRSVALVVERTGNRVRVVKVLHSK